MTPPTYPMRPMNGGPFTLSMNRVRYEPTSTVCMWTFQPKLNGWRALINPLEKLAFNRHLQPLSIASEFGRAIEHLSPLSIWADCEGLERRHGIGKGSLILLDLVHENSFAYPQRRSAVEAVAESFDWQEPLLQEGTVYSVPSFDYWTALKFWEQAPIINELLGCTFYEGLVAKRLTSQYKVQLRSDSEESCDWIKHRFTTL